MISQAEIKQRLIEAIKLATKEKGDKAKLAKKLGVDPTTISSYLYKNAVPTLQTFANLCVILDESADDILGISEEIKKNKKE